MNECINCKWYRVLPVIRDAKDPGMGECMYDPPIIIPVDPELTQTGLPFDSVRPLVYEDDYCESFSEKRLQSESQRCTVEG